MVCIRSVTEIIEAIDDTSVIVTTDVVGAVAAGYSYTLLIIRLIIHGHIRHIAMTMATGAHVQELPSTSVIDY